MKSTWILVSRYYNSGNFLIYSEFLCLRAELLSCGECPDGFSSKGGEASVSGTQSVRNLHTHHLSIFLRRFIIGISIFVRLYWCKGCQYSAILQYFSCKNLLPVCAPYCYYCYGTASFNTNGTIFVRKQGIQVRLKKDKTTDFS